MAEDEKPAKLQATRFDSYLVGVILSLMASVQKLNFAVQVLGEGNSDPRYIERLDEATNEFNKALDAMSVIVDGL